MDSEDPIVIVGIACRFPGEATSAEKFWDMISAARTAHGKIPANRFNADAYYHPDPDRQGSIYTTNGYFMEQDPGCFDAPFFSMTATEAAGMDPIQRLLLEVVYEGLENAGIPMQKVAGSNSSVFVGCFSKDYEEVSSRDIYDLNPYQVTGVGRSMLSNRVSWFFDMLGPSLTLDTACSASLYGLHLGCQSLLQGESEMSVVAGANIILAPDLIRGLCAMRFMSPDGRCYSFDSRANGYARGEGFSSIVLKRMSKAIADGDTIRAVIRSTGLNQDGKTPGITMPSATAQAALIRSCYEKAGLDYNETGYFEAHGTGTALGDPLELSALGSTFGTTRDSTRPLHVSSAKTNIGHQEGGAGLAGLIRAVLAIEKGYIPPLAHFEKPNPKLKLAEWKVALPTKCIPWPQAGLRRASVNSFGYGGANAHAVIDDAYHYLKRKGIKAKHLTAVSSGASNDGSDSGVSFTDSFDNVSDASIGHSSHKIYVYSAPDQAALSRMYGDHAGYLTNKTKDESSEFTNNLAFTLAERRSLFDRRAFVVADSTASLQEQLSKSPSSHKVNKHQNLLFVFTGQGAQYAQQGKELLQYPAFSKSVANAQIALVSAGCGWDIIEELLKPAEESRIGEPEFSQPLCTILQLAQVDLLATWNVRPRSVVGHSSGEIAAAYACGYISHADAVKIAYCRGVLSGQVNQRQSVKGAMMAVGLSAESAAPYLSQVPEGTVVVACINSPVSVTLSGQPEHLATLEARLSADGIFARMLKIKTAYHSPQMKVVADEYNKMMGHVKPKQATGVSMFSSVTSELIAPEKLDATYWVTNMLEPVQFSGALHKAFTHTDKSTRRSKPMQYAAVVEIGPHEALKGPIKQTMAEIDKKIITGVEYTSVSARGKNAVVNALECVAKLWSIGQPIDITSINSTGREDLISLVDLPRYPWNHSKLLWHEAHASKARRQGAQPRTDLLGAPFVYQNSNEPRWRNVIRTNENPWLLDHKVQEALVLPGAAMLVAALEAARKLAEPGKVVKGFRFREITFKRSLMLPIAPQKLDVAVHVKPRRIGTRADTAPWYEFTYFSFPDEATWNSHCTGLFSIVYDTAVNEVDNGKEDKMGWDAKRAAYAQLRQRATTKLTAAGFYKYAASQGYQYGPTFQGVEECYADVDGSYYGSTVITDTKGTMPKQYEFEHLLHPTTLDCFFQLPLGPRAQGGGSNESWVPTGIDEMYISNDLPKGAGARFRGYGQGSQVGDREACSNITMSDDTLSGPKVVITGLKAMSLSAMTGAAQQVTDKNRKCLRLQWTERARDFLPTLLPSTNAAYAQPSGLETIVADTLKALALSNPANLPQHVVAAMEIARTQQAAITPTVASSIVPQPTSSAAWDGFASSFAACLDSGIKLEEVLNEELLLEVMSHSAARTTDTVSQLRDWLKLVFADRPNSSVLLVGDGSASLALCSLDVLLGRFKNITITESSETALARSKAYLKAKDIDISTLKTQILDLSSQAISDETAKYDIIIAPNFASAKVFETLHAYSNPDALILISSLNAVSDPGSFFYGLDATWSSLRSLRPSEVVLNEALYSNTVQSANSESTLTVARSIDLHDTKLQNQQLYFVQPRTMESNVQQLSDDLRQRLEALGHTVQLVNLQQASELRDQILVSFMDLSGNCLIELTEEDWEAFKLMMCHARGNFWMTRGAQPIGTNTPLQGMSTGLLRTLGTEHAGSLPIHFDIAKSTNITTTSTQQLIFNMLNETLLTSEATREREYAEKDGKIYVPRLYFDDSMDSELKISSANPAAKSEPIMQDRPLHLEIGQRGTLESLRWVDDENAGKPMEPDQVEFRAAAMSLNFVDIMAALGQIPTEDFGCEAAGIITRVGSNVTRFTVGQEVVGTCKNGFRTMNRNDQSLVQELPKGMTAAEAVSCPTIYMTAYCALIDTARLKQSESILIHAAAGGLGQAAIQIAQWIGAEVFVTVGTLAKKQLIMEQYGIPEDHIFSSRDSTFATGVMRMTNGKGVSVILNSLAGEQLRITWSCIADFGRFIEVGKRDIVGNSGLEMAPFMRHITFASVNLEHMEKIDRPQFAKLMQDTFTLIRGGAVKAVYPITEYKFTELEKACRIMQAGKHTGKIVITLNTDDLGQVVPAKPARPQLDPEATYVLCGGLGGIGRSITQMLFNYGATHVVFVSRSGASKPEAQEFLEKLRAQGRRVDAFACDTSSPAAVHDFADECLSRGWKIKGFMQCAMALRNRAVANMSWEDWYVTLQSKVPSTVNFHNALPKDMNFFIMLASTSGILGAPGQGNYAAGNTYQDAFAYYRRSLGLSGISLDFGVVSDVGYIAENGGINAFDHFTGFEELHISEQDIHSVISAALLGRTADNTAFPTQSIIGVGNALLDNSVLGLPFINNPKFSHIRWRKSGSDEKGSGASDQLKKDIAAAASVRDAAATILDALKTKMARAIMIDEEDVDVSKPLHSFGVDSLVAVEIRNWIFRDLQSEVALFDLLAPAPLTALALRIAVRSKLVSAEAQAADGQSVSKELESASTA